MSVRAGSSPSCKILFQPKMSHGDNNGVIASFCYPQWYESCCRIVISEIFCIPVMPAVDTAEVKSTRVKAGARCLCPRRKSSTHCRLGLAECASVFFSDGLGQRWGWGETRGIPLAGSTKDDEFRGFLSPVPIISSVRLNKDKSSAAGKHWCVCLCIGSITLFYYNKKSLKSLWKY